MKKHNTVKVVLLTTLVLFLLTWILPAAYYSGEYVDQGRIQMGLFDIFNYPLTSLSYFGYIAMFIVLVGGFYGVLYKIPAYRNFLDKIIEKFEGKNNVLLSIMVVVIALLVSVCGLHIGIAIFIPFIVSLVLLMGYDKIVAAMVTVGSIVAGLVGTTYSETNLSVLLDSLGLDINYQIGVRFVILLVGIVLVIFNIIMYNKANKGTIKPEKKTVKKAEEVVERKVAEKVESVQVKNNNKKKSTNSKSNRNNNSKRNNKSSNGRKNANKAALKDEDIIVVKESFDKNDFVPKSSNGNHAIWPMTVAFCLFFILIVLAFFGWSSFNISIFEDATKWVQEYSIGKEFYLFAKVLGTINSFGTWTITDMFLPMVLVALLLAFIYKISFDDVVDGFVEGAKKALAPAVIVILVYNVLVLVTYHPFQLVIYKWLLGMTKGFNIITTSISAILASIFNSDINYSFQSIIPYFTSVVTKNTNYPVAAIIFQTMYGFTNLFAPTSLVLMGILAYLDIPYTKWLKNIWKLLLELFVILLIIIIILALI